MFLIYIDTVSDHSPGMYEAWALVLYVFMQNAKKPTVPPVRE